MLATVSNTVASLMILNGIHTVEIVSPGQLAMLNTRCHLVFLNVTDAAPCTYDPVAQTATDANGNVTNLATYISLLKPVYFYI